MRLTLRTLLAYLDHTLDPADEAALGEKVRQSSFATDLVQRIRGLLSNPRMSAPSPDAVGPTNDANSVAEYLDSTLPAEATAEVERQCMDSDEHLAEVAACHQVLTIALGEPAVIPPALRQRIYAQPPDRDATAISAADPAAADQPASGTVTPVGPADSGVADATTRLPQEADLTATLAAATATIRKHRAHDKRPRSEIGPERPAMAGDRSREALEAIGPLLSGGRPSRVTPWLVSIGLAAVFLFVLAQAFEPYSRRRAEELAERQLPTAEDEVQILESSSPPPPAPVEDPAGVAVQAPRRTPAIAAAGAGSAADEDEMDVADAAPPVPAGGSGASVPAGRNRTGGAGTAAPSADQAASEAPPLPGGAASAADSAGDGEAPPQPADSGRSSGTVTPVNPDVVEVTDAAPPAPGASSPSAPGTSSADLEMSSDAPPLPGAGSATRPTQNAGAPEVSGLDPATIIDAAEADRRAAAVIGQVEEDGGLLLTQAPDTAAWDRLTTDAEISSGTVLVASPTFRSRIRLAAGAELTLVGATGVRIDGEGPAAVPRLTIDFGRVLIESSEGPMDIRLATPAGSGVIHLSDTGATAAVSIEYRRPSGADPGVPGNSQAVLSLLSVQDQIQWEPLRGGESQSLDTGTRLQIVASGPPEVDTPASIPAWLDAPDQAVASIEATARAGLVEFLAGNQPLEVALRDAVNFRREEVAALAARTLLNLGMPGSYFGPSGVLNRPAQRSYWPQLTTALRNFVDRGPHSAAIVARAVTELEGESADELLRLLQGFSAAQLEQGGDAALVAMLDHPAMSVRVLATETLREITGTSLYYRPDYETAARRAPVLKKWQTQLERKQIRFAKPAP